MNGLLVHGDYVWRGEIHAEHASWENTLRLHDESPTSQAEIPNSAASTTYYLEFDLFAARAISGWGFFGHNLHTHSIAALTLKTGTSDDGITYNESRDIITGLTASLEPHFAATFTEATKRYWRVEIMNVYGGRQLLLGGVYLGTATEFGQQPSSPLAREYEDTVLLRSARGGGAASRSAGPIRDSVSLAWALAPTADGASLDAITKAQDVDLHPVCYVPFDTDDIDPYGCEYMVIRTLDRRQLPMGTREQIRLNLDTAT